MDKEQELLRRIADGDHTAYRQVFDQYYTGLTFFARSIVGKLGEAEDIVQDAFLRLWTKRTTLQSQGNLRSFLYTMVKNACLDYLRRLQTRTARQEEIAYLAEAEPHFLESVMMQEELLQLILQEIQALPDKYRSVITLIFLEGLSYPEISRRLDLPEATVRKQKERALRLLNHALLSRGDLPVWLIAAQLIFFGEVCHNTLSPA